MTDVSKYLKRKYNYRVSYLNPSDGRESMTTFRSLKEAEQHREFLQQLCDTPSELQIEERTM